ncbi:MAG: PHP domain-containing protein [Candidatus Edwardsbacteria bacterium]|nr:PHP domain-containing protein [Candidatus Edwardsbacteria bacterium]
MVDKGLVFDLSYNTMIQAPADLHTHSIFSDGKATLDQIVSISRSKGMNVGVANHCGPTTFQIGGDAGFERYFRALSAQPVYRSAELDLGREIRVSLDNLQRCDYLIGGVHSLGERDFFDSSLTDFDVPALLDRMLSVIEKKARIYSFDILAHPGLLPVNLRPRHGESFDTRWDERLIGLALECGFALEISSRWQLPPASTVRRARQAGVKISFGSDAHRPEQVCRLDHCLAVARECGLRDGDLFRPARQLAEKIA